MGISVLVFSFVGNKVIFRNSLQYRIARRGAEMLAIDGKMVYSTCSLNPIEDEAVIHRLLLEAQGSLVLEEVAEKVPGLKYVPGLSHWTVMSRDLTAFKTPEEVPETLKHSIRGSLFPPKAEDADKFNLKRWYVCKKAPGAVYIFLNQIYI